MSSIFEDNNEVPALMQVMSPGAPPHQGGGPLAATMMAGSTSSDRFAAVIEHSARGLVAAFCAGQFATPLAFSISTVPEAACPIPRKWQEEIEADRDLIEDDVIGGDGGPVLAAPEGRRSSIGAPGAAMPPPGPVIVGTSGASSSSSFHNGAAGGSMADRMRKGK